MMGNVDLTREVLLFCALSLGQRAHFLETHLKKKKWEIAGFINDQEIKNLDHDPLI